jgi:hypothetical protein
MGIRGHRYGVPALACAVLCLVALVAVERRNPDPMLEHTFFKVLTFSAANAASATMNFAMFGLLFASSSKPRRLTTAAQLT